MKPRIARDIVTHEAIHVDAESRHTDIPAAARISRTHAAVFDGDHFSGIVPIHTAPANQHRIFADLVSRGSLPMVSFNTPLDDVARILQSCAPYGVGVTDEEGHYEGVITRDALLSALLGESQDRLEEITTLKSQHENLRLLGQMATVVAHELNNILSVVVCNIEMLLDAGVPDAAQTDRRLKAALTSAQDAAAVVQRIQNYYLPAKRNGDTCTVNLVELINEVALFTRPKWYDDARRNGRAIELVIATSGASMVQGNPGQIREVITNLVLNAEAGIEKSGTIRITVHSRGEFEVIEVIDNGSGMDAEQRLRCFEPFFTTRAAANGTGLGLSISSDIVREHGGRIEVESEPGKGSTFRVFLPAATSL